jgi:aryl-alcohol dehydrogenase-like predicted oxidoreductase
MDQRQLGNTELLVSEIGFGCMSLQLKDPKADIRLLKSAYDAGINLFDTADLYAMGQNEVVVGQALKDVRKSVIITTKVGNQWRPDRSGWDWNPRRAYIETALEDSLRRLQTDYIDLYLLHGGMIEDPIEEVVDTFEKLREQGKIKYYGISSIRPNVIKKWTEISKLSACMMQYGLLDRRPEEHALQMLANSGVGLLARGTLAKGNIITGKGSGFLEYTPEDLEHIRSKLPEEKQDRFNIAASFPLQRRSTTCSVIGIRTTRQLKAATSFSFSQTPENILHSLQDQHYENHRV